MDNAPIFPNWIVWKDAHEKAPDFIKGSIHINADKLIEWLQSNPQHISERGWIVLDLKEPKKGGNYYFSVNTWKPTAKPQRNTFEDYEPTPAELKTSSPLGNDYPVEGDEGVINPEDIPF